MVEGKTYVAMRPLVEGLGLTWMPQFRKIRGSSSWGEKDLVFGRKGQRAQKTIFFPVSKLALWMNTLPPAERFSEEVREAIETFGEEHLPRLLEREEGAEVVEDDPAPREGEIVVPFYGQRLILADVDGEPYVAMKPIVEGMGLAWQVQHRKLSAEKERWSITIMVIEPKSSLTTHEETTTFSDTSKVTQGREQLYMPLRNLFGWLMTIHPTKVNPEIRKKILQYQKECNEVLWRYWTRGTVINPRVKGENIKESIREALAEYEKTRMSSTPPPPAFDPEIEREKLRQSQERLDLDRVIHQREQMRIDLERATHLREIAKDLHARSMFDQRYVQRLFEHSVALVTGEPVSPKTSVDLRKYLESKGVANVSKWTSYFGKLVAQEYRNQRGKDPGQRPMIE